MDELRKAFALFDTEKRGKINVRDLRRVAKEVGESMDDEELQSMIDEFDLDGDGESTASLFRAHFDLLCTGWTYLYRIADLTFNYFFFFG
jgi:Ca2+-binding EF-hand superfamily protein